MKIRKYISGILAALLLILIIPNTNVYASSDEASQRLKNLGILDISGRENSITTREDFVKAIVKASGLEDEAASAAGTTIFSDISKSSTLSGYVNIAVNKGLMTGMSDRKFHPEGKMTFAQVCTLAVKVLGYADSDLQGTWPNNYISKAKSLGITEGITLEKNNEIPLWATASILSKMLDTNVKSTGNSGTEKTYADMSGLSKESFIYGKISNPVYSEPAVASGINRYTTKIGSIDLTTGSPVIVKDGKIIGISDIEDNDIVYQVSDANGIKRYILVVDKKIKGKITALSSTQIQIDNIGYNFGNSFNYNKILDTNNGLKVGEYATVLLGYDGKVVDYFDIGQQDNNSYAFVINYEKYVEYYTVKLLMIDGNTREYKLDSSSGIFKGELVQYAMTGPDTVTLTQVAYQNSGEGDINKSARTIDGIYVSHNAKIFNVISDNSGTDIDADVEIYNWSDLPDNGLLEGNFLHLNTSGSYGDINVIVSNDMFDKDWQIGIISQKSSAGGGNYNYNIVVDGAVKNITSPYDYASPGQPVRVKISGNNSMSIDEAESTVVTGYAFGAVDVNRIKINAASYYLEDNAAIYTVDKNGSYLKTKITEFEAGKEYSYIYVYVNPSNGKAIGIVVNQ